MAMLKYKLQGCLRSMTIWFNSVAGVVMAGLPMLQDSMPQLQGYLPADFYKYAMGVVLFANILLRFKTNLPLEAK